MYAERLLWNANMQLQWVQTYNIATGTIKSSLERVSNAVRGCIDGAYRELCHESAMNIILGFLAK